MFNPKSRRSPPGDGTAIQWITTNIRLSKKWEKIEKNSNSRNKSNWAHLQSFCHQVRLDICVDLMSINVWVGLKPESIGTDFLRQSATPLNVFSILHFE